MINRRARDLKEERRYQTVGKTEAFGVGEQK